jgi:hypothetical protein
MIDLRNILSLADAYATATDVREVTLSHRLFGDSKKLAALRNGADMTVGRFNAALLWFSANWPATVAWPEGIERPTVSAPETAE